jgi:hypothetical protein
VSGPARVTTLEWIQGAEPSAPAALVERVAAVLRAHPEWDALPVAEALTNAGEVLLGVVLGLSPASARESALDLLAADACVTWAFEAAADDPATLPARAQEAMQRIAEVAR